MRSAAQAKHTKTIPQIPNVHQFVGGKIRQLRSDMPLSDFATKNGMHHAELGLYEYGEAASLYKLKSLAQKNGVKVEFFFPNGKVPKYYPEF